MNPSSSSDSPFPASSGASGAAGSSGSSSLSGSGGTATGGMTGAGLSASMEDAADAAHGTVRRMAQKAHEAVDRLEETLGSGSERVMDWQQEYGDMAREQVRSSPLAAVGIAFAVGLLFGRVFMR